MHNILRGEVDIMLGGGKYVLRPTFQALAEIESEIGCSIFMLPDLLLERKITLPMIKHIILAGLKAAENPLTEVQLEKYLLGRDLTEIYKTISVFIAQALGGMKNE